jgi:hypothetical protein
MARYAIDFSVPAPTEFVHELPRGGGGGRVSLWESDIADLCSAVEKARKPASIVMVASTLTSKDADTGLTRLDIWRAAARDAGYRVKLDYDKRGGMKNGKGAILARLWCLPTD